ncbi:MAG TPA: hypothetical protein VKU02_08980 [Gemmataceae bacterium]|nr:hypothetical protein [Gemmataceae bacterium]
MNRQQLWAVVWLHWRLRVNRLKRSGAVNAVILAVLAVAALLLAVVLSCTLFLVGAYTLVKASPPVLLLIWDGMVVGFLFCWTIGLISELQRSEVLSLEKFLHLPVSLAGAFLVNYFSSLLSLNLIVFVPAMLGLALGLVFAKGPAMLLLLPLLAAFLLMVTAITYQFQGWLASLMVNPRRRRTIIVLFTAVFILLSQLPNLINIVQPWKGQQQEDVQKRLAQEQAQLQRSLNSGEITVAQYQQRLQEIQHASVAEHEERNRQYWEQVEHTARLLSLVLPPGWLPLGAMTLAERQILPAVLGTLGFTLLGAASLWRAYSTTLRLYTGQFTSGKQRSAPAVRPTPALRPATQLLERKLPRVSEHVSAVTLGTFRSLLRAPEVKMMLLTPIILVVIFGAMLVRRHGEMPDALAPLIAFGAMAMVLMSMVGLVGNQFGFDRSGFRVFVLCPADRREILLGKNLAFAPLALGLGVVVVCVLAAACRMRLSDFLATFPQLISMYLLFCMLANTLSILSPMPVAAGSFKPTNMKGINILIQLGFVFLFPLALTPTLLPLGIQFILEQLGWSYGVPICLLLSLLECAGIVYLYRLVLTWQGDLLQARELKILDIVAARAE